MKDTPVLFDKFLGQKVSVDESSTEAELFGKKRIFLRYEISKSDTVIAELRKEAGDNTRVRVWLPNTIGTHDYRLDRINVKIEKQGDGSYEITRIYFG
jgi:hypothetical protein